MRLAVPTAVLCFSQTRSIAHLAGTAITNEHELEGRSVLSFRHLAEVVSVALRLSCAASVCLGKPLSVLCEGRCYSSSRRVDRVLASERLAGELVVLDVEVKAGGVKQKFA